MSKTTCICGLSVHLGCQIIVWFQLICALVSTPAAVAGIYLLALNDPDRVNVEGFNKESIKIAYYFFLFGLLIMLVANTFTTVTSILLLYGYKKNRPNLYTPYLIFTLVCVVFLGVYTVFSIIAGIYFTFRQDQYTQVNVAMSLAHSPTMVFIMPFIIYFYYIVPWRSQKMLQV